jgi:hypothetical protein
MPSCETPDLPGTAADVAAAIHDDIELGHVIAERDPSDALAWSNEPV